MLCQSCNALYINGIKTHERGCPDAWKDYKRECKECGGEFVPEYRIQDLCSESCANAYHGFPDDFEEEEID